MEKLRNHTEPKLHFLTVPESMVVENEIDPQIGGTNLSHVTFSALKDLGLKIKKTKIDLFIECDLNRNSNIEWLCKHVKLDQKVLDIDQCL